MKRNLGSFLMIVGTVLILGALSLFLYNQHEQTRAGQASAQIMSQIQTAIGENAAGEASVRPLIPTSPAQTEPVYTDMKEVEIDGYAYVGYLSIPALGLELPIMSQWDYDRLKIAPCRFSGTLTNDDLVIAGHNYIRHFGPIRRLSAGDSVIFTDAEGLTTVYEVAAVDILASTAVEEVTASGFDLTLFTCTYGGEDRVTVFCNRTEPHYE